jgi:hypothetical protein
VLLFNPVDSEPIRISLVHLLNMEPADPVVVVKAVVVLELLHLWAQTDLARAWVAMAVRERNLVLRITTSMR